MPKKDDAPEMAVCDGCGMSPSVDDVTGQAYGTAVSETPDRNGHYYCERCAERRAADPPITVQGRILLLSEMKRQIEDGDKDLAAAFDGDTVQDQIKAAYVDAKARSKND